MRQSKAMGLAIIQGAVTTREDRTERAGAICPLCGRIFRRAGRLCKLCATRCERQARAEQERDYLARWLSTRDEDLSVLAELLRAKARAQGVDWLYPPEPLLFKDRITRVIEAAILAVTGTPQNARVRGNAGRGVAVEPKRGHLGTPRRKTGAVQLMLADPAEGMSPGGFSGRILRESIQIANGIPDDLEATPPVAHGRAARRSVHPVP